MKYRHPIALSLMLLAGTAFAATPATNPAPANNATSSAKAPAKAKTVHCKKGESLVHGKCEKPKA